MKIDRAYVRSILYLMKRDLQHRFYKAKEQQVRRSERGESYPFSPVKHKQKKYREIRVKNNC